MDAMITSPQNAKIRELVKLKKSAKERAKKGLFLVEGPKMFWEIPEQLCREVYVSESFARIEDGKRAMEKAGRLGIIAQTAADPVFRYLSDTQTPQGILAVVSQLTYGLKDLTGTGIGEQAVLSSGAGAGVPGLDMPLVMILENLQDPGNLGTILRTAEAAGATGILLSSGCADLYSPKVTRSTMGSIFRVPFVYTDHLGQAIRFLQERGLRVYAAHLKGSRDLYEEGDALKEPVAFLVGNESRGLTAQTAALADAAIRIPMSGKVESLNAAIAAGVMMFEAKRLRRILK